MNSPIDKLKAEHQIILQGISLLEKGASRLENGADVSPDYFRKAIEFIRNYADKYHHAKEENILFVKMGQLGFSPKVGPIAVMLYEHDKGRSYIAGLSLAVDLYAAGDRSAVNSILENIKNYAELLKQHINKENIVLYPMAENAFGIEGLEKIQVDFQEAESDHDGVETKYIELLKELAKT
jgi:hemerythrin-like domain-containing protein